ncbi:MAG: transglutaminase family protein, partial [Solirubrobacteraceae bacterium]|nr:transglutaminase family protein [Solirubrobacteraceae bacterium]
HIPLSCTPTPAASAPISGAVEPAETTFEFSNTVTRVEERPRVTLPYTTAQWAAIDALGHAVDTALEEGDVRLTMGGEPTFVAADDMEADEWNTAADGPTKHALAVQLALRLADRFAPGAVIQHGQGKWYPGEPLPRWEIGVRWRTDGEPLWRDRALLAHPTDEPEDHTAADADRLMQAVTARLGLERSAAVAAYEDPVDALLREARLPGGDPPELDGPEPDEPRDADARAALIAQLDEDRGEPIGWALPLHRGVGDEAWQTGTWTVRRGNLFLIPGDSPMGLRLPLDALTWTPPVPDPEPSEFATVGAMEREPKAAPVEEVEPPPITSLCIEVRDGRLHVFLPPLDDFAHAAELLAIIEDAAAAAATPVVIEGYAPSGGGERANSFSVTPDPGVIEINIHPSTSWEELVAKTETLDEEARRTGLTSEKFALDGMHTGTGGGAHITLGGTTPKDSPFLRRPDLLRSLVTFWQHHPSLSYLFSGRFIGPTSQSPRVDEARHENLYELEIAFSEMERLAAERKGRPVPAWQVDRLLRNLLTDLTGNTHRAEFCIDKLYSPDSERGRLGVVELRGFEMPPHPQMALVQALLVRALVARFWSEPYAAPLVRWGTELHDRFLLPWFVAQDIRAVVTECNHGDADFDPAWLDPFLEFRFPHLGTTQVDDVTLELRMAIEPWNVLGEESASGSTARYVDSSLERVQVRVDGMIGERHVVTCNGERVPLQPTGAAGEFVAAVRYRAWQPWSALHPTIGIHSPLVFDLIDRWTGRSLGGCTYHVVHPGGRSYDTFPVNASEAQSRRSNRFEAAGHTPGPVTLPPDIPPGEYPRTLDLRRPAQR